MNERLLLALPHRQFVFAFPKLLRPYFRHNRRLFSEISRLIFAILQQFYDRTAKRPIRTGMVLAYQSSGEFLRGFSVDASVRIPVFSDQAREALSQYIARSPLSLKKIGIEENGDATACLLHLPERLTQHIPPKGRQAFDYCESFRREKNGPPARGYGGSLAYAFAL
jgi:hypothetical protein